MNITWKWLLLTYYLHVDDIKYFIFKTLKYPTFSKNNLSKNSFEVKCEENVKKREIFLCLFNTTKIFSNNE